MTHFWCTYLPYCESIACQSVSRLYYCMLLSSFDKRLRSKCHQRGQHHDSPPLWHSHASPPPSPTSPLTQTPQKSCRQQTLLLLFFYKPWAAATVALLLYEALKTSIRFDEELNSTLDIFCMSIVDRSSTRWHLSWLDEYAILYVSKLARSKIELIEDVYNMIL